jgi:hypothetical protein
MGSKREAEAAIFVYKTGNRGPSGQQGTSVLQRPAIHPRGRGKTQLADGRVYLADILSDVLGRRTGYQESPRWFPAWWRLVLVKTEDDPGTRQAER